MTQEEEQTLFVREDTRQSSTRASTISLDAPMQDAEEPVQIDRIEDDAATLITNGSLSDSDDSDVEIISPDLVVQQQLANSSLRYLPGKEYNTLQRALRSILRKTIISLDGDRSAKKIIINLRHDEAGVMNMRLEDMHDSIHSHYAPNLKKAHKHLEKQLSDCQSHYEEVLQRAEDRKQYRSKVLRCHRERFEQMEANVALAKLLHKDLLLLRGL